MIVKLRSEGSAMAAETITSGTCHVTLRWGVIHAMMIPRFHRAVHSVPFAVDNMQTPWVVEVPPPLLARADEVVERGVARSSRCSAARSSRGRELRVRCTASACGGWGF